MSAIIVPLRATRAAYTLQRRGWQLATARAFCDALEALPCSTNQFAYARRILRAHGWGAKQTRDLLVELGYIEAERCAYCARAIKPRACRTTFRGAAYCAPYCVEQAVEARRCAP